jgi:hypothetical protein
VHWALVHRAPSRGPTAQSLSLSLTCRRPPGRAPALRSPGDTATHRHYREAGRIRAGTCAFPLVGRSLPPFSLARSALSSLRSTGARALPSPFDRCRRGHRQPGPAPPCREGPPTSSASSTPAHSSRRGTHREIDAVDCLGSQSTPSTIPATVALLRARCQTLRDHCEHASSPDIFLSSSVPRSGRSAFARAHRRRARRRRASGGRLVTCPCPFETPRQMELACAFDLHPCSP